LNDSQAKIAPNVSLMNESVKENYLVICELVCNLGILFLSEHEVSINCYDL